MIAEVKKSARPNPNITKQYLKAKTNKTIAKC